MTLARALLVPRRHLLPHTARSVNRMSTAFVHHIAQKGFGVGTNDLYDRARPSYQAPVLSHVRNAIQSSPPYNVVEIGAGTGIFTRALLAHPEWSTAIKELHAVEPSEGMREVFDRTVADERVSVAEGTFDSTGVPDGWADLVVIAQAFHWCPDYDKASAEFARILKPNGFVAFVWNLDDRDAASWVAQLRDLWEEHEGGSPQFRLGLWRATFSTPSYTASFEPPEENLWRYELPANRNIVVDRACSKSFIAILEPEKKQQVVEGIHKILDKGEDLKWIDKENGVFEYPYTTTVVIARKKQA